MGEIIITQTGGNLNRRAPSQDYISGLAANGVAVPAGAQLGTPYTLKSLADAKALGINADYDNSHSVLVFHHINEYFRANPSGELHLLLVAQSIGYADMLNPVNSNLHSLLKPGKIRQLAVAYNPTVPVTDFSDTEAAIDQAQALAAAQLSHDRPLHIVLEGKGLQIGSIPDLRTKNARHVSVMAGQAMSIAATHATYAAVGTALGNISRALVNESIGHPAAFNARGGVVEAVGVAGLWEGDVPDAKTAEIRQKGIIFLYTEDGEEGVYFSSAPACTALNSDYHSIQLNRTMNKVHRQLKAALFPNVESQIRIDGNKLDAADVSKLTTEARNRLQAMYAAGEISDYDLFIDPEQDVINTDTLAVQVAITPTATASTINVTLGFTNPL